MTSPISNWTHTIVFHYKPPTMKFRILILFFTCFFLQKNTAQLANGTVAPNWTMSDINGTSHTLYNYLNTGKVVVLDFSATWCAPCWNYHNSHAIKDFHTAYGPNGTNQVQAFFIEDEIDNTTGCLYGSAGGGVPYQPCSGNPSYTHGDWVTGTTYPIIDNASQDGPYQINYFPTVYMVCPSDKKTYLVGVQTKAGFEAKMLSNCGIAPTAPLSYSKTSTNETCSGLQNGTIALTTLGGIAPYTYKWSNAKTTSSITNLAAGNYTCTITDSKNSKLTTTAIAIAAGIALPNAAISVPKDVITCATQSVNLSVNACPSCTYKWSSGQTTATVSTNAGNVYAVTVTQNACTNISSKTITEDKILPTASIAPPLTLTCKDTVVTLAATASMGTNITYSWSGGTIVNGANTLTPKANKSGTYSLTVTNTTNACTNTASVVLAEDKVLPTTKIAKPDTLTCIEPSKMLSAVGTSSGANFTYLWSGNTPISNETTLSPIVNKAGFYILKVTNTTNGCIKTDSAEVFVNQKIPTANIIAPIKNINCKNIILPIKATSNVKSQYTWGAFQGGKIVGGTNNSDSISVEAAGVYSLTVTDIKSGCEKIYEVTITETIPPTISATSKNPLCFGEKTGEINTKTEFGSGGFSYLWSNGLKTENAKGLAAATYTVTVTDVEGCTATSSKTLESPKEILINNVKIKNASAANNDGSLTINVSGGTLNFTYEWTKNGVITSKEQNPTNLSAGTYTVKITDANGCFVSQNNIVVATSTSIKDLESVIRYTSSPNPTSDFVRFNMLLQEAQTVQLTLFDISGKVIATKESIFSNQINESFEVSDLARGTYFLQVKINERVASEKIIVE